MKKLCILISIAFLGYTSNAQNFVYSTDQHVDVVLTDTTPSHYIKFKTSNPEEITYMYEVISNTMPLEWDYSLCDYNNCYVGVPNSGRMNSISLLDAQNGLEGYFNLSATFKDIDGEGDLVIYVYDSNDQNRGDTVSYHYRFGEPNSMKEVSNNVLFTYPNPVQNILNIDIKGGNEVIVYNLLGEKIISKINTTTVNVSTLELGIYILSVKDANGSILTKKFVKK